MSGFDRTEAALKVIRDTMDEGENEAIDPDARAVSGFALIWDVDDGPRVYDVYLYAMDDYQLISKRYWPTKEAAEEALGKFLSAVEYLAKRLQ